MSFFDLDYVRFDVENQKVYVDFELYKTPLSIVDLLGYSETFKQLAYELADRILESRKK